MELFYHLNHQYSRRKLFYNSKHDIYWLISTHTVGSVACAPGTEPSMFTEILPTARSNVGNVLHVVNYSNLITMVTNQKHQPMLQLSRKQTKKQVILQCALRLSWQRILLIYSKSLCKKVVTLTLMIFLIN